MSKKPQQKTALRVQQKAVSVSPGWWEWSVWLEGAARDLNKVEWVTYFLHKTFLKPVRVRKNRAQKFRLESGGWGEFSIRVKVHYKNGRNAWLRHELVLEEQGAAKVLAATEPGTRPLKVFLSASSADRSVANAVREAFRDKNVKFLTAEDSVKPGEIYADAVQSAIRSSDATIGVFSDATNFWVPEELSFAKKYNIPVIPLVVGESGRVPTELKGELQIKVKGANVTQNALHELYTMLQTKTGSRTSKNILQNALGKIEV